MPATSEKQKRFMDAAAHNPAFAKAAGIPVSVAKEFSEASKGQRFGSGGSKARAEVQGINKPKTDHGGSAFFSKGGRMATKMKMFEKSSKDVERKGMREGSKKEEAMDRKQMMGMKKMAEGGKSDLAQDKAMIKKAFKQHDAQEHKGSKGTSLKLAKGGDAKYMKFSDTGKPMGMAPVKKMAAGGTFRAAANGIAKKGKTRGTEIAMCGGGMYKGKK